MPHSAVPHASQYIQPDELLNSVIDEKELFPNMTLDEAVPARMVHELRIESFPVWYFSSQDASTVEIAHLLDLLIRDYHERTSTDHLLIPSVIELSLYFQCPEVQLVDAFEILARKGFNLCYDTSYSKVCVTRITETSADDSREDNIDWRDITHDFYTDVVEPVKNKLSSLFA